MASSTLCALLILFSLPICILHHEEPNDQFLLQMPDMLELAMQWPSSVCQVHRCTGGYTRDLFTVHGLFRQDPFGNPINCGGRPSMPRQQITGPLLADLEQYWPTLRMNSNWTFWEHEWGKHASCFPQDSFYDPKVYFTLGIDLMKKVDATIETHFQNMGINSIFEVFKNYPIISGNAYLLRDYEYAFSWLLGGNAIGLSCISTKGTVKYFYLSEIRFCFSATSKDLIACKSGHQWCPTNIPIIFG